MTRPRPLIAAVLVAALAAFAGCGKDNDDDDDDKGSAAAATQTIERQVSTTRVEVVKGLGSDGGFNPGEIYRRESPGVVTVIRVFDENGVGALLGGDDQRGLGSGFVLNAGGEIATNAHVVSSGEGNRLENAREVYVAFEDGNQVPARIVGTDPNSDVALLRIDPAGLTLRPLPLGSSEDLVVGAPVAAIGSPFGEPQSLSIGVISGLDRTIDSLTNFSIAGAVQTDAAINRGNSGGPLVNAKGEVIGINSQIRSTGGGGEGVGFAVPASMVRRSLDQLRRRGKVAYAFVGVSSTPVFPQLAKRFNLGTNTGAWVQQVTDDGPAEQAGIREGEGEKRFQAREYSPGGDVIIKVGDADIDRDSDLSEAVAGLNPGQTVTMTIVRDRKRRTIRVKLGERPVERRREPLRP